MELFFVITFILFLAFIFYNVLKTDKVPSSDSRQADSKPDQPPLSDAQREAMQQAADAFDWETHFAILGRTYDGPLPEYDGYHWTNMYPDLYRTKIAGINLRHNIDDLDGTYFSASLVPEPKNEYDPNAVKVFNADDGRHLGYIPADETDIVREWTNNHFPYPCRAHVERWEDYDEYKDTIVYKFKGVVNIKKYNNSETK